ncbi:hypothetical protein ACHAXT_002421 [Thalassiosira profunda]
MEARRPVKLQLAFYYYTQKQFRRSNSKMGSMVGEKAEEAMSNKLWKESKISWMKYKCYKTYKTVKAGECCS